MADNTTILHCGALFDGVREAFWEQCEVLVEGGMIKAVGQNLARPAGVKVIDLSGLTVTPGLIDAHMTPSVFYPEEWENFHLVSPDRSVLASFYAAEYSLRAGFTTLRLVNAAFGAPDVERVRRNGYFALSRVFTSLGMGVSGGSFDGTMLKFANNPQMSLAARADNIGDGADFFKGEVRRQLKIGFDFISLNCCAGLDDENPGWQQMDDDEVAAAINTAHRQNRFVTALSYNSAVSAKLAQLGVDGIESGSLLDEQALAVLEQKGVYLVPTFYADQAAPVEPERAQAIAAGHRAILGSMVKLGFGSAITNAAPYMSWLAYGAWLKLGADPFRVLKAATSVNADMLGMGNQLGRIVPGWRADIAGWSTDLLNDAEALRHCSFVMQEGRIIQQGK